MYEPDPFINVSIHGIISPFIIRMKQSSFHPNKVWRITEIVGLGLGKNSSLAFLFFLRNIFKLGICPLVYCLSKSFNSSMEDQW